MTIAYIASIAAANAAFLLVPPLHFGTAVVPVGSFLVGATFILRDFAQREIGHRVLLATLAGTAITAAMSPGLALASGVAFLVSEVADWAVFSRIPGSFTRRVVASSLVGAPIDSMLFMTLAGFFSWAGVAVMTAVKLVALLFVCLRGLRAVEGGGNEQNNPNKRRRNVYNRSPGLRGEFIRVFR